MSINLHVLLSRTLKWYKMPCKTRFLWAAHKPRAIRINSPLVMARMKGGLPRATHRFAADTLEEDKGTVHFAPRHDAAAAPERCPSSRSKPF